MTNTQSLFSTCAISWGDDVFQLRSVQAAQHTFGDTDDGIMVIRSDRERVSRRGGDYDGAYFSSAGRDLDFLNNIDVLLMIPVHGVRGLLL